ncbi:MAG: hypothetical protein V4539_17530 [Bacteroidota bacterium]
MPRIILLILLPFFCYLGSAQTTNMWQGDGEYLQGLPFTALMKKMAAEKKLEFLVATDGSISGRLVTKYNKSKAVIPHDGDDQHFSISGRFDAAKRSLLLIITHFRSKPDASETYLTFSKPDTVYYDLSSVQNGTRITTTGIANRILNKNTTGEWVGSFMGGGLGMNLRNNVSMHILPLRIRFETSGPLLPPNDMAAPVLQDAAPAAKTASVVNLTSLIRETKIQRTIVLDTSFIKLELYDNGEVDGDIATLVLDGKIILDKQLLSARAAIMFVNLSKHNSEHTIELFANNMGSIPPNTALLVLTCKNKRYEINLTSTETANGSVRLIFKEK